ncbi:hypothetical protein NQ318_023297 [Aromia moschata]|uniref:Uncharacterized protein n=1 Tax=Aromia moschata TaxID=1265417 RepID=A0AAV8XRV8_9CUCU|nr:hypothetical protein NQ318_023297 [Aromia moschata]
MSHSVLHFLGLSPLGPFLLAGCQDESSYSSPRFLCCGGSILIDVLVSAAIMSHSVLHLRPFLSLGWLLGSMNKDNGPIPTSPLFAQINKDSNGSVNRGNKFSINSARFQLAQEQRARGNSGDRKTPNCGGIFRQIVEFTVFSQAFYSSSKIEVYSFQ